MLFFSSLQAARMLVLNTVEFAAVLRCIEQFFGLLYIGALCTTFFSKSPVIQHKIN